MLNLGDRTLENHTKQVATAVVNKCNSVTVMLMATIGEKSLRYQCKL